MSAAKSKPAPAGPQAITLIEAITQALAHEMRADESVVVLGEDVGVNGGVFRATAGLHAQFGSSRVIDTPLDETTIAGLTVGMASQGMKPVAEAQFDGFMYPMVDFLVCHAARMRYRTRGRLHCPMVLRVPWGGGIRAPEHHSEANEAIFTNVPGLRVVMPSSPSTTTLSSARISCAIAWVIASIRVIAAGALASLAAAVCCLLAALFMRGPPVQSPVDAGPAGRLACLRRGGRTSLPRAAPGSPGRR